MFPSQKQVYAVIILVRSAKNLTKDPRALRTWIPGQGKRASARALVPWSEHGLLGHCGSARACPADLAAGCRHREELPCARSLPVQGGPWGFPGSENR